MNDPQARRSPALVLIAMVLLLSSFAFGQAQTPRTTDEPAESGPDFDIDLSAMLHMAYVFEGNPQGPVWQLTPSPGKRFIKIPVTFRKGKTDYVVDTRTLRIRGGRLLAWQLTDPEFEAKPNDHAPAPSYQVRDAVPPGAPLFTKEFEIRSDGSLHYGLERRVAGGTVRQDPTQLYCMLLDSSLRNSARPKPPDVRRNPGEPRGEFAGRSARATAQYRMEMQNFRDISDRIRDLPDEFTSPELPSRVWAIFEITFLLNDIEIDGPAPLPWNIGFEDIRTMYWMRRHYRADVSPIESVPTLPDYYKDKIRTAYQMMATSDRHPYTARLVSYALASSGITGFAAPGDQLYGLLQQLIAAKDSVTQTVLAKELVTVFPPTTASRTLLAQVGRELTESVDFQATQLGIVTRFNEMSPIQLQEAISELRSMLGEKGSLPVGNVLAEMMTGLGSAPNAVNLVASALNPGALPPARRDEVIVWIIENSANYPAAAAFLDMSLLGSNDPEVVKQTLKIINAAQAGASLIQPAVDQFLKFVFGDPDAALAQQGSIPRPRISDPIPIDNARHALFLALQHGDGEIRSLAWQALPFFAITIVDTELDPAALVGANPSDPYTFMVDAALATDPTPLPVVDFLAKQPDELRGTTALMQVVARGGERASKRATQVLLGSGRPIDVALLRLPEGERQTFAQITYQNLVGVQPLATALLRQRTTDPVATEWFGKQIASGRLPLSREWVEGAGGEDAVINLVGAQDPELVRGAIAALVATVGGDDRIAQRTFDTYWNAANRDAVIFRAQWIDLKRVMMQRELQRMITQYPRYHMTIQLGSLEMAMATADAPAQETFAVQSTLDIGVIDLTADESSMSLNNGAVPLKVSETDLRLTIEKPIDLKNLASEDLAALPLETMEGSIDLLPQTDASWAGQFKMSNGQAARLVLSPAVE